MQALYCVFAVAAFFRASFNFCILCSLDLSYEDLFFRHLSNLTSFSSILPLSAWQTLFGQKAINSSAVMNIYNLMTVLFLLQLRFMQNY